MDLGPFRLVEPVARGASGEVWRAVHRAERLPVALKVLTAVAPDGRGARQFAEEIRALASLDHPHVVTLLDAGTVGDDAGTQFRAGSPWLALEYASGGTVGQRAPTTWPAIRELAHAVLDALAHAHARGLVHRDLKPANLLWCGERDPRPGLKLTDFGIAVRYADIAPDELPAGTPHYMAPEQLGGDLADIGPWTDLYSFGCLIWRLTTGALPFDGMKRVQLVRAHMIKPLPPFVAQGPVPPGLEEWLRTLLAKRPEDRPQRAADAAAALAMLDGEATSPAGRMWTSVLGDDVELEDAEEAVLEDPTGQLQRTLGPPGAIPDWRAAPARRTPELVGAGLGLLVLREPAVVGRPVEQDLLWDELRAADAGASRVVVLRGAAGSGRTRLARWLCTRADELGAARVVWVDGAGGGFRSAIRALLRVGDREGGARERHLLEALGDPDQVAAAIGWLDDTLPDEARAAVAARLIGRSDRATVVCLDDADRAPLDVEVALELSRTHDRLLCLAVLDDLDAEAETLARLVGAGALDIALPPLDGSALRDLLASLVRLDDALAAQLEARSEGNPAFVVDVLADWVARGWLAPGARGTSLRPDLDGEPFPPPGAASARRVAQVLSDVTPATAWDLTMAAALGPVVDESVWHTACDDSDGQGIGWSPDGVARRAALVERLTLQRVLSPAERGFRLQAPFRDAVVAQARERGRWAHVCASAARTLSSLGVGDAATRGRLLLEGGAPAASIPLLLRATEDWLAVSARRALAAWVEADRARQLAQAPPSSVTSQTVALARARIDLATGDLQSARAHLPVGVSDPALADAVARVELDLLLASGELETAAELARRLLQTARDPVTQGALLLAESEAIERTEPRVSLARLEEARECWSRAGVASEQMAPLTLRQGRRARQRGDLSRARVLFERVLDEVGPRGDARLRTLAGAALAEVLARTGDAARGVSAARRATAAGDAAGVPTVEARIASATCRILLGEPAAAAAELDEALRAAIHTGRTDLVVHAHACFACAHAVTREWARSHDHLREVERADGALDVVVSDVVRDLQRIAKAGGYPQLAARARALAAG